MADSFNVKMLQPDAEGPTLDGAKLRWDLLHPSDGWSLRDAIAWLVTEGRLESSLGSLTGGFGEVLRNGGAPIGRIRITTLTLHPLVTAWGAEWHVQKGREEQDFLAANQVNSAYVGSPIQIMRETGKPYRQNLEADLTLEHHALFHELKADGMTDYYALFLMGESGPSGIASFSADRPGGFAEVDIEKLETLALFLAPAVDAINKRRIAATLLDTYIGHRAGGRVLAGHIHRGDSEHIRAAFWYSDLRDFTGLNEELEPGQMIDTLNTYFGAVGQEIMSRGGEVLQFIGDAVLAIFECAPEEGDTRRACEAAFDAAQAALVKIGEKNRERREAMLPEIRFGIGLHVGDVTFGNVGAEARLGFNVIGPAVNMTARLESLSKRALVPLLMSSTFAAFVDRALWPVGTFELRGVREMQEVYTAADLVGGEVMSG